MLLILSSVFPKVMHNRDLMDENAIIEVDEALVDFHGGGQQPGILILERKIKVML